MQNKWHDFLFIQQSLSIFSEVCLAYMLLLSVDTCFAVKKADFNSLLLFAGSSSCPLFPSVCPQSWPHGLRVRDVTDASGTGDHERSTWLRHTECWKWWVGRGCWSTAQPRSVPPNFTYFSIIFLPTYVFPDLCVTGDGSNSIRKVWICDRKSSQFIFVIFIAKLLTVVTCVNFVVCKKLKIFEICRVLVVL